jgi:hypothetical protein
LEHAGLQRVVAVELCQSRFDVGVAGLRRFCTYNPKTFLVTSDKPGESFVMHHAIDGRQFEIRRQNLFDCIEAAEADIVVCETAFPEARYRNVLRMLARCKVGARIMLYHELCSFTGVASTTRTLRSAARRQLAQTVEIIYSKTESAHFQRLTANTEFATSWAPSGHPFDLWNRI